MQSYGAIIVVGGGCYGSYYVRQLHRARKANAIEWERLVVVDRDSECQLAVNSEFEYELVTEDWGRYFYTYLTLCSTLSGGNAATLKDAIVPSPLMPHLMYEWLVTRAKERWPERSIETIPLAQPLATPWQRSTEDGTHYASFATWMCPINCIEPRICPHTKSVRDWDMIAPAQAYASDAGATLGPFVFQCTHRAYGVGMFETSAVIEADMQIHKGADDHAVQVLVGTVSHCHGAFNLLQIGAATPLATG